MPKSFFASDRPREELVKDLSSSDAAIRWAALMELGGSDKSWARDLISSCLGDTDALVAKTAHDQLGLTYSPRDMSRGDKSTASNGLSTDFSQLLDTLLAQRDFSQDISPFALELELRKIAHDSEQAHPTTEAPFPQADRFERVLQIIHLWSRGYTDTQSLVSEFEVDERQVHYYLAAAKYLGLLVETKNGPQIPSEIQRHLDDLYSNPYAFFAAVAKLVVRVPAVSVTFLAWEAHSLSIDREISLEALRASTAGSMLGASTLVRRSRTVYSWAWWIRRSLNSLQESWVSSPEFRPAPIPNFEAAVHRAQLLGEREVDCLCRRNNIFDSPSGKTLQEVGEKYGVSRERMRQVETEVTQDILGDINLSTGWNWESDFHHHLEENLTFDSAWLMCQISGNHLGEAISNALLYYLNCEPIGTSRRFWSINSATAEGRISQLRDMTPLLFSDWLSSAHELGLSVEYLLSEIDAFAIVNGVVIDEKKRRIQLVLWHLNQVRTSNEQELASICGEPPSRAFSEALRRSGLFKKNHLTGNWQLADSPNGEKLSDFSSVYDAVIHILETRGPTTTSELHERMGDLYPVSYARVIQALDHGLIGRLDDKRVALLKHGGTRRKEEEPKMPTSGLWEAGSEVHVHKVVDQDILRGSGFSLPKWLQWKFQLWSTPESVNFQPGTNTEQPFIITRRGGQTFGSSIMDSIKKNEIDQDCGIEIVLNCKDFTWRLLHNHQNC